MTYALILILELGSGHYTMARVGAYKDHASCTAAISTVLASIETESDRIYRAQCSNRKPGEGCSYSFQPADNQIQQKMAICVAL